MKCVVMIAVLLLVGWSGTDASELVLVDRATPPAPIIVYKGAPPRTRDAAETLADYIEKMSGARPVVHLGQPSPLPERAIWIGVQPFVEKLFPRVDFRFQHPEEIVIVANGSHLVIAGRDRWDPSHMEAEGRLARKTGMQQEYGTANAVYTFLQEDLGVRWLWPDEEDVVERPRIALESGERRYHPQIRARSGMFQKLSLGDNKEGADELWARFQRVQLDSLELLGGHAFSDWWEKYHDEHPDYFALQPDGTRSPHPTPTNTKLCESNPAVWQRWLAEVEEELAKDPTRRVFNVSENDGYDYGHCVCAECLAKDHPDGEKFTWRWKGKTEQRPALSDRQVRFANTLARLLRQRFPDRQLFVQLHAYGYSRPAPIAVAPDDNVIVSSVANFHLRGEVESDGGRREAMRQLASWSEKAKLLMWRPNLGNPVGLSWGMPDVALAQAAEDFRFVADHHGIGLFFDLFWFHWATQGPHYYLLAQLAWNPYADAEAMMADYYQRAFGPAAAELKAYWTLWEQARMEFVCEKPNKQRAFDIPEKYTPELFALAQACLDRAEARLAEADEKYRRRLDFVRHGLEYARLVVDTRSQMQRFEASRQRDAAAKTAVLANWNRVERMRVEFPEFAINLQAVFRMPGSSGSAKRIIGLHPDFPLSGRQLEELRATGQF